MIPTVSSDVRDRPRDRCAALLDGFAAAIDAARLHVGATAPNPPVGCTALDVNGVVLATAAHRRAGGGHAERLALDACRDAGVLVRVTTLLVTLEPCDHVGRTPPCTQAILAAGVPEIRVGVVDPNPRVAGAGIARLRAAGRTVGMLRDVATPRAAALADACDALIRPFATWIGTGRPWVTVKRALDPGGGMIPPAGATTFTSPASLHLAHALRRQSDAILTGSGTILADAPAFTVRHLPDHDGKRRPLLIADRRGRVPPAYARAAQARGLDVRPVREVEEAIALAGAGGALRLLVEAGPRLTGAVLAAGLWDELVTIRKDGIAPGEDRVTIELRR